MSYSLNIHDNLRPELRYKEKDMRNFLKHAIVPAALAVCLAGGMTQQAQAQLVVVEDTFRIVEVDHTQNRIGIAKPDADPNVRQNWLYIEPDTKAATRHYSGGYFRDRVYTGTETIVDLAEMHEGQLFKVNGGRDWDGSIDASKIWL